jgi:hypothetical protein
MAMVSFFGRAAIAIGLCVAAMGAPALAQTTSAVTSAELEQILGDAGLSVGVIEDAASGAPVASAQVGNVQFWVRGMECSGAPQACGTLIFFANFPLGRPIVQKDYEIVNRFNDSQVYGRAYLLSGRDEVGVDYVIELEGGVTADHLAANIGRWADVIGAFITHFSEGQQSS